MSDIQSDLFNYIGNKNYNGIHQCLLKGADINYFRKHNLFLNTPLMYAIYYMDTTMIKFIIDKNADLNIKTKQGNDVIKHIYNVLKLKDAFNESGLHAFIRSYKIQKRFIDYNNEFFKSLKECKFIHPDILIEYAYLNSALDLNLL